MNQSEVEDIDATVREIFDGIVDDPIQQLHQPLEFIKENKFGFVWKEESERHEKVMSLAKTFMQTVTGNFRSKHGEAAKHIEGSVCDVFATYVCEKLDESTLGADLFEDSCKETKTLIIKSLMKMKKTLETKPEAQPKSESELELMISNTELFDPIHIHHALLCCRLAYNCKDPENVDVALEELEKEHVLSEVVVSYENEEVPKYVMARCGDVLYVSFPGRQYHNFGSTEKCYRGEICTALMDAARKIPVTYFAREIMQQRRIVFSGHSSGGAIASLVLVFLLEKFKDQKESFLQARFKCITFGLMPLADVMFAKYVEDIPGAQECFCHIVQQNDIVPKLFGSLNMERLQSKLWKLVDVALELPWPLDQITQKSAVNKISEALKFFVKRGREYMNLAGPRGFAVTNYFAIFGMYYILGTGPNEEKYTVATSDLAPQYLLIDDHGNLANVQRQYVINHKIERYAHEVEMAFLRELPDFKKYKSKACSNAKPGDITPKITQIRFENIGEEVVGKITGSSMWFVYNVSITGIKGDGKDLEVNIAKSTESEVQTRMRETNISHRDEVCVRVKTHFENSKYLPPATVPATTTKYAVSRRQQQLAKHSPCSVIELAFLSALLERRDDGCYSKRFNAIKEFFESAVTVVPLESLFHAIANGEPEVMLQCCEMLYSCDDLSASIQPSDFLLAGMNQAVKRVMKFRHSTHIHDTTDYDEAPQQLTTKRATRLSLITFHSLRTKRHRARNTMKPQDQYTKDEKTLIDNTIDFISTFLRKSKKSYDGRLSALCNIDLAVVYPSADVQHTRKRKAKCCKAPMSLLTQGRTSINKISDAIIAEHSSESEESATSKANTRMLAALNDLRKEFKTCSTLLGAFMESQAQIPLEKPGSDSYVNKIAKHASSHGLSVWAVLILPFKYLYEKIGNFSEDFGKLVIRFSRHMERFRYYMFPPSEFPNYVEKLEFLVGSMKKSWTCNQNYVSYSLERQLKDQCRRRNIFYNTAVDEILEQWHGNFENETLTLVPNEYRPLIARWIKWSLMINNLRENLAEQTAVGVIGLVNSGKSKFVRSMFGKQTITGTTDQKRTTIPLIYNLAPEIKGLDVIDFPGVDDSDKSIPELAELLLSLTRIIVFVVDYRRAHTESTKEWLSILAKENVPVLICLTFADKLYAELMGRNKACCVEKIKTGVENQLNTIKEQIGQPESGHRRDFKLTVFSFDNDSNLNDDEGKRSLRQAGLCDELDVGRWIAEKLQDYEQNDVSQNDVSQNDVSQCTVSQNVLAFIESKEQSTLNSNRRGPLQPTEGMSSDVSEATIEVGES